MAREECRPRLDLWCTPWRMTAGSRTAARTEPAGEAGCCPLRIRKRESLLQGDAPSAGKVEITLHIASQGVYYHTHPDASLLAGERTLAVRFEIRSSVNKEFVSVREGDAYSRALLHPGRRRSSTADNDFCNIGGLCPSILGVCYAMSRTT